MEIIGAIIAVVLAVSSLRISVVCEIVHQERVVRTRPFDQIKIRRQILILLLLFYIIVLYSACGCWLLKSQEHSCVTDAVPPVSSKLVLIFLTSEG